MEIDSVIISLGIGTAPKLDGLFVSFLHKWDSFCGPAQRFRNARSLSITALKLGRARTAAT
jgi:hypothetical protein